jgi:hypothetical protein
MLTREEFNDRIDDLREYIGHRFDVLDGISNDHEMRLRALENAGQPNSKMAKAGWVTGIGGVVYGITQYLWTTFATKGDVK